MSVMLLEGLVIGIAAVNLAMTVALWRRLGLIHEVVETDLAINYKALGYVSAPKPPPFAHPYGPVK